MKREREDRPIILIVEDSNLSLKYLTRILQECNYDAVTAENEINIIELVKIHNPAIILLDVILPNANGFDICRELKKDEVSKNIPIIFITAKSDINDIVEGFNAGGVDYVTKPFNDQELISRIKTHVELKSSNDKVLKYAEELEKAYYDMKIMMADLEIASKTDFLTGLLNRKSICERIELERTRFKRRKEPFTIIIADIDHFKTFNDNHGHDCGDYILKMVSNTMQKCIREQDSLARWGGEEFLFFMPETTFEGARVAINRLRNDINTLVMSFGNNQNLSVTLTFGVALYQEKIEIDKLIRRADDALYYGKSQGRNCIGYNGRDGIIIEK